MVWRLSYCFVLLLLSGCASQSLFPRSSSTYATSQMGHLPAGNNPPAFSDVPPPASNRLQPPGTRRANTFRTTPNPTPAPVVRTEENRSTQVVPATRAENQAWDASDLILGPQNVVAIPGAEVIVTAGIRDRAGYLRTNQPIRWSISPESVGHFTKVPPRNPRNIFVGDFIVPTIESDTQAISTTSRVEQRLDRGTPNPQDDVLVLRGQTWISVSSAREGITWVTATAPKMENPQQHTRTMKIVWVDAEYKLPESRVIDFGGRYTMVTTLRRRSNTAPLANWRVRYEILGNTTATFADGNKMLEVLTDARGEAKLEILQPVARQEDTDVQIQIIRPAEPGTTFTQPVVVQQSRVKYRWIPNTLTIQKTMPSEAYVKSVVPATICVQNLTNEILERVRVVDLPQEGLKLVGSIPEGTTAVDGTQWLMEALAPQEVRTIQLKYEVERPGNYLSCTRGTVQKLGDELVVESCARLSAGSETSPYIPQVEEPTPHPPTSATPPSGDVPEASTPGVRDPFATNTPSGALPPPPMDGSETPPSTPPLATSPSPPATPSTTPSETLTPSTNAHSPARAMVLPLEDPETLVSVDMVVPAEVKKEETFSVVFEISNRSASMYRNSEIEVRNTAGLKNENQGDSHRMIRLLEVCPPGKRIRLGGKFQAVETGEQTISFQITTQDGKSYSREAKLRVTEGETPPAALPTTPPPAATSLPVTVEPSSDEVPRLELRLDGPTAAHAGESVEYTLHVKNPLPTVLQQVEVRLEIGPESRIYGDTSGLRIAEPNVAVQKIDLAAEKTTTMMFALTCQTPAEASQNRVVLRRDGKVLAEKAFTLQITTPEVPEIPEDTDLPAPTETAETASEETALDTDEKHPANPVATRTPPTVGSIINELGNQPLVLELTESASEVKVGETFEFTLSVTNTTSRPVEEVGVLMALPTDLLEIQKDDVRGPTEYLADVQKGVVIFDPVKTMSAGETVLYKVVVKALGAGVIEAHAEVQEKGKATLKKQKEIRIEEVEETP
ncbi:MAG: hypothetical protein Q4D62_07235 [Planctomycetia bacterium]|nr:hypothetical protein [Planctomycetia bacterium]